MQMLFSFICVLFFFIAGNLCYLTVSPTGPVSVEALVGTNVTLGVSHAGASEPEVMWFMGSRLIAKWTVGDDSIPGVASNTLKPEQDGSLTFINVPLSYNSTYTVEMTKIGEAKVSATFDLFVYDIIMNVSLHTDSDDAVEGEVKFTLYYSTMRGEAKEVRWLFNGLQLKNGSHYSIGEKKLTINQPSRNDTGRYTVLLTNPFSSETHHRNVTVLYGPDLPVLKVSPTKAVFVSGESPFLSCQAEGEPAPSTSWFFNGESIATSPAGTVHLNNVKTSQSGVYTCVMVNTRTEATLERNVTVIVYEPPSGGPLCSVQAVNGSAALQFLCLWPGGAPEAQVSFPGLSDNASGYSNYSITINDIQRLNGQEIICKAEHPLNQTQCSVIPRGPVDFLPVVLTSMSKDERTMVVIHCSAEATPEALVLWIKNGEHLQTGSKYQISTNTSQLFIHDFNATSTDLDTYTCTATNPLGNITVDTTLLGPQISNSSVFLSDDQTEVTLTWHVPLTSVITGFDIQMKGPELSSPSQPKRNLMSDFCTIQVMPASAGNTTVSGLDPKSTYYFRIIPKAGRTAGEPSEQLRIRPAAGLSGAAIAGLAAGLPCAVLVLLVVLGFICCGTRADRSPRYPVSRAVEKVVICRSTLLRGRLKPPPEYRLHQAERSGPLPSVNSGVRMATTV
ncbi:V-set and immunoglobulin domain-containing protein 10-like isoform X1 [Megalobrama amblycephala]|uniref:V-set and immunoglobulin domain-containing protein 10-like isoform X1 n=1 Tax=Megalobrama amblycephala TaxID=75352 RepID=UPI002013DB7C|nr:V-set and immunoglobulin domain-containing protein 10-like isoform X1 [Megalobrama amblycephala]